MKPTLRNRWYVKISGYDGSMKIYAETEERVRSMFHNEKIESITPCQDFEYMQYIEKLVEQSKLIRTDNTAHGSQEWYCVPFGAGYIRFRLGKDMNGGYYDLIEFQEWQLGKYMEPITFAVSNPKDFYLDYFSDKEIKSVLPDGYISAKELKKTKAKLISRKCGEKVWVDGDGYFYSCDDYSYPNKRNKEEYKKFHDNPNAVLIKYWSKIRGSYTYTIQWFSNLDEFLEFFAKIKEETPASFATPRYEVRKTGYTKLPPDERKVIYRYPYYDVDCELRHGKKPIQIAMAWNEMCNPIYIAYDYYTEIERMIIEYQKWKEKG